MRKTKFYICPHCRNTVDMVYDTDIRLYCCGDEKAVAVYAYCNLHGLWKTEL